jgi:hypothetical protein
MLLGTDDLEQKRLVTKSVTFQWLNFKGSLRGTVLSSIIFSLRINFSVGRFVIGLVIILAVVVHFKAVMNFCSFVFKKTKKNNGKNVQKVLKSTKTYLSRCHYFHHQI